MRQGPFFRSVGGCLIRTDPPRAFLAYRLRRGAGRLCRNRTSRAAVVLMTFPIAAFVPRRRIQRASKWHRNRNIQRVSTITTQLLTIMRPRITIIRRSTITRSASMKRPRSTPRQLRSTASLPTSIRQTLTRTLINDVTAGRRQPSLRPPLKAANDAARTRQLAEERVLLPPGFQDFEPHRPLPLDLSGLREALRTSTPPWTRLKPQTMMYAIADCGRPHGRCALAAEPGPRQVRGDVPRE